MTTPRDSYAAAALAGLLANQVLVSNVRDILAHGTLESLAWDLAERMVDERARRDRLGAEPAPPRWIAPEGDET
jgi:hypothetical protein